MSYPLTFFQCADELLLIWRTLLYARLTKLVAILDCAYGTCWLRDPHNLRVELRVLSGCSQVIYLGSCLLVELSSEEMFNALIKEEEEEKLKKSEAAKAKKKKKASKKKVTAKRSPENSSDGVASLSAQVLILICQTCVMWGNSYGG